ncbi:alpha/beta fold hydrolase [Actinocorallia lasiicapitis]
MTVEPGTELRRITSFTRDGLVFDVSDEGPLDGDVVLLLHGFPQTSSSWDLLAPLLHAEGYRTVAPDQRGYSPGARPRGRFAYRLSELTEDALTLIGAPELGGRKVHVVGHDWGASVAWALANTRPEVLASLTALSVPHPAAFMRSLFTSRQFLMSWYMFAFQLPLLPELIVRQLHRRARDRMIAGVAAGGLSEAAAARDADFLVHSGALTPAINWYRAMVFSSRERLAKIDVPTLFVRSDGDQFLVRKGAELTRRYVTGPYTFATLEGIGHWIPEQAAPEVAALLVPHLKAHP